MAGHVHYSKQLAHHSLLALLERRFDVFLVDSLKEIGPCHPVRVGLGHILVLWLIFVVSVFLEERAANEELLDV